MPKETSLYRIRVEENRNSLDYTQMFHIPLTQRNRIKTQRYSFPGYPCLYLGKSIYACWEEINRPLFNNCMVSLFKNQKQLKLLDVGIPVLDDFLKDTQRIIESFPIRIACLFQVNDTLGYFKPEYIFPQLIMQLVISDLDRFDGILYTTSHYNKEFKFPYDKFLNIVIPVKDPLSTTKNCPRLAEMFTLTDPTCYEFEDLKYNIGRPAWETFDNDTNNDAEEKGKRDHYESSRFSILEESLKENNKDKEHTIKD